MTVISRRTQLRREGFYHLAVTCFVLLGAWIHQISLLFIVGGMMLGPLLYSWPAVVWSLRGLRVVRRRPTKIGAGDLLVVRLEVENVRRWFSGRALIVEDQLVREQAGQRGTSPNQFVGRAAVLIPKVASGEVVAPSYQGPAPERGVYRFGPLQLSTRFPLGLVQRKVVIDDPATLVVHPRLGTLTPRWRKLQQTTHTGQRQFHPRQSSSEADFFAMREWRTGDSNRWIHWPTSARRRSLVVRQFEQKRHSDLVMLADLWLPAEPTPADRLRLETAISFLATVTADACRGGETGCIWRSPAERHGESAASHPVGCSARSSSVSPWSKVAMGTSLARPSIN